MKIVLMWIASSVIFSIGYFIGHLFGYNKDKYKVISYEHEGTANEGLHVLVSNGEDSWSGYLERRESYEE